MHVWTSEKGQWVARALNDEGFALSGASAASPSGAVLRRSGRDDTDAAWYLLAPPTVSVFVNGEAVPLGIRVLRDRDEIRVAGGQPVFFSTEKLIGVEPYAGVAGATCLRCAKTIERNSPAVRCPGCGRWYHQSAERGCFTYGDAPICVECGADAVVSDQFQWMPEEV